MIVFLFLSFSIHPIFVLLIDSLYTLILLEDLKMHYYSFVEKFMFMLDNLDQYKHGRFRKLTWGGEMTYRTKVRLWRKP